MASYWEIFIIFAKIGAFTIGGGYAMIPIIQSEIVKRGWLDEKDFPDIIALAQSAPGLLAVNISIFIGYRLKGVKGSIVATLGSILPSFLIILLIAMLFSGFQDNRTVHRIFQGIRPVVVALIAVPMLQMARKTNHDIYTWTVCIASMVLVAFLEVSPIYILVIVAVVSYTLAKYREDKKKKTRDQQKESQAGNEDIKDLPGNEDKQTISGEAPDKETAGKEEVK